MLPESRANQAYRIDRAPNPRGQMAVPMRGLARQMTATELFKKYSTRDGKHELARGRLIVSEPPGGLPGWTATRLASALHTHVERHGPPGRVFVETGFVLERDPDTVRSPDVSFVRHDRIPTKRRDLARFLEGPPDLAVEIL